MVNAPPQGTDGLARGRRAAGRLPRCRHPAARRVDPHVRAAASDGGGAQRSADPPAGDDGRSRLSDCRRARSDRAGGADAQRHARRRSRGHLTGRGGPGAVEQFEPGVPRA